MKPEHRIEILTYLVVSISAAMCLLISARLIESNQLLGFANFLHELGFAGLVSMVLVFTIERFSRARFEAETAKLIERIHKNIFEAIYGRFVPSSVFREVENLLLDHRVYRKELQVGYELIARDDSTVLCRVEFSYVLVNPTDEQITHVVTASLESPMRRNDMHYCRLTSARLGNRQLSSEELARYRKINSFSVSYALVVKLAPHEQLPVFFDGEMVKEAMDTELWTAHSPSDKLRLHLRFPKGWNVEARSIHSRPLLLVNDRAESKIWELDSGLLPHQGVTFWWRPERIEAT